MAWPPKRRPLGTHKVRYGFHGRSHIIPACLPYGVAPLIRQYCVSRFFLKIRNMDHLHILFDQKGGQSRDLSDEVDVRVMLVTGMDAMKVLQIAVDGGLRMFGF
jgi:hypothetical protein